MTFEQLEDLFYALKINASPSAFHGFLCGRLTCGAVEIEGSDPGVYRDILPD